MNTHKYRVYNKNTIVVQTLGVQISMVFSYGGAEGIRTLGRLLTVTRFPVVPVMTSSILLHMQF